MKSKHIWISLAILFLIGLSVALFYIWKFYGYIHNPNFQFDGNQTELLIYPDTEFEELIYQMKDSGWVKNTPSLFWVADRMNFSDQSLKTGRYLINDGINNRQFIQQLRSGNQAAVNLVVPEAPDLEKIAGRLGNQLMQDSIEFAEYFNSQLLHEDFAIDKVELKAMLIPNTYQMWWTASPKDFVSRMQREYNAFWDSNNRREKAKQLGLTEKEVIILASIVERESNYRPERPAIAGVYINRLKNNWPLQADPTVVFAMGNPKVRRVLTRDLEIDSPYNTYKNTGLPPGPIFIPSISSIDAVLNAEEHNYYFFCAAPDHSGTHVFARTLAQHNQNARRFHNWLNQQRIMR